MRSYRTNQGDTWDKIAGIVYGSGRHTGALLSANMKHAKTVIFEYGVELVVPDIDSDEPVVSVPWKKVEG